eukprot:Sspe_Gene.24275::Locus_9588_Transcript_2_2_Confidence_0.667_Length_13454::g.24275::m.24275
MMGYVVLLVLFVGCCSSQTVEEAIRQNPQLTILSSYLERSTLAATLAGPGPFTLLAPTNDAWDVVGNGTAAFLWGHPTHLRSLLEYHIVSGVSLNSVQLMAQSPVTTAQGSTVTIIRNGNGVVVNSRAIIAPNADIPASNGLIHLINRVLVYPSAPLPTRDLFGVAQSITALSTFVTYLSTAGMASLLQEPGPLTVIAPSNVAFSKLTAAQSAELLSSPGLLTRVLRTHLVQGLYNHTSILVPSIMVTMDGTTLATSQAANGSALLNGTTVVGGASSTVDVWGVNGVLHVIDTLLLPPSFLLPLDVFGVTQGVAPVTATKLTEAGLANTLRGTGPFTLFAPLDTAWGELSTGVAGMLNRTPSVLQSVLHYHLVNQAKLLSGQLATTSSATSANGDALTFAATTLGGLTVNSRATVTDADRLASNGVVHVVNKVLLPPSAPLPTRDVVGVVGQRFLKAYSALLSSAMAQTLHGPGPFTFFAPSDAAFASLGPAQLSALLQDTPRLTRVLRYHTVSQYVSYSELAGFTSLPNLEGGVLTVATSGLSITLTDQTGRSGVVNRTQSDIPATNGVVHAVDRLLLPSGVLLPGNTVYDVMALRADLKTLTQLAALAGLVSDPMGLPGPYTVFAPSDTAFQATPSGVLAMLRLRPAVLQQLLLFHIAQPKVDASALPSQSPLTTVQGRPVSCGFSGRVVVVNGNASIVIPDILASNGVVHVVDNLLLFPGSGIPVATVLEVIRTRTGTDQSSLSSFHEAIMAAQLEGVLSSVPSGDAGHGMLLTVFAPTNAAWANVSAALRDPALLRRVVGHHISTGYFASQVLAGRTPGTIPTREGTIPVSSDTSGNFLLDGTARTVVLDLFGVNGVVHIVDRVVLPPGLSLPTPPPSSGNTVYDVLRSRPDLTSFTTLIDRSTLISTLKGPGTLTVFAPTNTAMAKLPSGVVALLNHNLSDLKAALYHHIAPRTVSASAAPASSPLETLATGEPLVIRQDTVSVVIEGTAVIQDADMVGSNGVVHAITEFLPTSRLRMLGDLLEAVRTAPELQTLYSNLLTTQLATVLQGSGPITVFAPTDTALQQGGAVLETLQHHLVPSVYLTTEALVQGAPGVVVPLAGTPIPYTAPPLLLNSVARIVRGDIPASNGVLHIIDTLITVAAPPPPSTGTVFQILSSTSETTDFATMATTAGVQSLFSDASSLVTVFAPSNTAWNAMPFGTREVLARRPDLLSDVVRYHVISGAALTTAAAPFTSPSSTLQGGVLVMENVAGPNTLLINRNSRVVQGNLQATNGMVHILDRVLLPPSTALPTSTVMDVIAASSAHTVLSVAIERSGFASVLSGSGPVTLFAPSNDAFAAMHPEEFDQLMANPSAIAQFLRSHTVPEYLQTADLMQSAPGQFTTMSGSTVRYSAGGTVGRSFTVEQVSQLILNPTSSNARITTPDRSASNGIVHVVNSVLVPTTFTPTLPPGTLPPTSSGHPVAVWGDPTYGGDATTVAAILQSSSISSVTGNIRAFAAVMSSGAVVGWGDASSGGQVPPSSGSPALEVTPSDFAFAVRRADGSVSAWGNAAYGGSLSPAVAAQLACCVTSVKATSRAFAAIRTGAVVSWGAALYGGDASTVQSLLTQVSRVESNDAAFAAFTSGGVVAWGLAQQGGDATTVAGLLSSGVVDIVATYSSFAALKTDGSVVAWGASTTGGDVPLQVRPLLQSGVSKVFATSSAFAALKADGSVVTWGASGTGGDATGVQQQLTGVQSIYSTSEAFAAVKSNGGVVTWGGHGGDSSTVALQLQAGISRIANTDSAFAAVKDDGSVVTWGSLGYGGQVPSTVQPLLSSGVVAISGNDGAFAASKADGTVVTWGSPDHGGDSTTVATLLRTPIGTVRSVSSTVKAFAAFTSVALPPPPPVTSCSIAVHCASRASAVDLVNGQCVCQCFPRYAGQCNTCAPGFLYFPLCTPTPLSTPTPGGVSPTVPPALTPLPTSPPTSCLTWTACNGHASSVIDDPVTGVGCICSCFPNYAGPACETCASGFVGYPQCSKGIWVLVSESKGCFRNAEDIQPVYGADTFALPSLLACQQACTERTWCMAVDWYRNTGQCRMYDQACADPLDVYDGASHWKLMPPGEATTPIPTLAPTGEDIACPWVSPSGRESEYDCSDGSTCNYKLHGEGCCRAAGGRLRCPVEIPIMCSTVTFECADDYCCVATEAQCARHGGVRPCIGMNGLPCGISQFGGDGRVWNGRTPSPGDPPTLTGLRSVYSNDAAYAAVRMNGSVVTWGASFAGGDSASVQPRLAQGVVLVHGTARAFAALKTDGSVVTWGDNGLGQDTKEMQRQLASGVSAVYSTDNAFAAVKDNGGVVTWGDKYSGGDATTVAALLASGVTAVYSTRHAFAAVRGGGSVVSWGAQYEGDSTTVASLLQTVPGVDKIYSTDSAFAAVRKDGSVVTWGYTSRGGNMSSVARDLASGVARVYSTSMAFAALKVNGSVVAWGDTSKGGDTTTVAHLLRGGVTSIASTNDAFSALKADGTVVSWGDIQAGGQQVSGGVDISAKLVRVKLLEATDRAFAAVKTDATVVAWGDAGYGGDLGGLQLTSVQALYANQREFAAVKADGKVATWGNAQGFGTGEYRSCDAVLASAPPFLYGLGVKSAVPTRSAFVFLAPMTSTPAPTTATPPPVTPTPDDLGSLYAPVVTWGNAEEGGAVPSDISSQLTCGQLHSTNKAFAALRADGSVVAWGHPGYGGDTSTVASALTGEVEALFSTDRAFAALKRNGAVVAWGDAGYGGKMEDVVRGQLAVGVHSVYSTQLAFAAVKDDGSVVTWGDPYYGGLSSPVAPLLRDVVGIYSTDQAFAAHKKDGSVVTWGSGFAGGDMGSVRELLRTGVQAVYHTYSAFAAVKTGGSVVTWGYPGRGGDSSTVKAELLAGVQAVASTEMAFAALKKQQGSNAGGRVVAWGDAGYGGDTTTVASQLTAGVRAVYSTQRAFAALKEDGTVVAWGNATYGGYAEAVRSQLQSISEIYSTERAFAALRTDGKVVAWGDSGYGGRWSASASRLDQVAVVYASNRAFAALRHDGSVVTWGNTEWGGDSSAVANRLRSGQRAVYSTESAFASLVPCALGSKTRTVGPGACLDAGGVRYQELKAEAGDRAECVQILLRFSPPARGATWFRDAPGTRGGLGGCYIAVDAGGASGISGGTWLDRFSFDTATASQGPRNGKGKVASSDSQKTMECIAADEITFVPTPPPGTPPPATTTPTPTKLVMSWVLVDASAGCERNTEGILPIEHNHPLATLELCRRSCEQRAGCLAIDYYDSGWCNLYDRPCHTPLDTRKGAQSWKRVANKGSGMAAVAWGDRFGGGDATTVAAKLSSGVKAVYATDVAFAALKTDGSVVTWGQGVHGGDSSTVQRDLSGAQKAVQNVASNSRAFAAIFDDGSVVSWGDGRSGGNSATVKGRLQNVLSVHNTDTAFAAIGTDGSVVAWGDPLAGGDASTVSSLLTSDVSPPVVYGNKRAFALLRSDGRVVTWGDPLSGGDSQLVRDALRQPTKKVNEIFATDAAFAAIRDDGSVVTWGGTLGGGDAATVAAQLSANVQTIVSTSKAFAALKSDGSVVAWGDVASGGDASAVETLLKGNVVSLRATESAFAALKSDGTVVAWGDGFSGGNFTVLPPAVFSPVVGVYSTRSAFAAVRADGSVAAWGDPLAGGAIPANVVSELANVDFLVSTDSAFAAIRRDGRVVTWGDASAGGNSVPVAAQLSLGVQAVSSTSQAFAALVPSVVDPDVITDVLQCPETSWVTSPRKTCVAGVDRQGVQCDSTEILGGTVVIFYCAARTAGGNLACARCPVEQQTPAPGPVTDPVEPLPTTGRSHRAVICTAESEASLGKETGQTADGMLTAACPAGTVVIETAFFGRRTCEGELCYTNSGETNCNTLPCWADVTDTVRLWCEGRSACNLDARSQQLVDLCPGVAKYLEVSYSCNLVVCEAPSATRWGRNTGQVADVSYDLACPSGSEVVVDAALFGRRTCDGHLCYSDQNVNCGSKLCQAVETTSQVRVLCDGKPSCTLQASTAVFGDPCPLENKYLQVKYTCQGSAAVVRKGGCRDQFGGWYREYKKAAVSRETCIALLRAATPPARAAMYWPDVGCYIAVDAGISAVPNVTAWDSFDSRDTFAGERTGKGPATLFTGVTEAALQTAECLVLGGLPQTTAAPPPSPGGTPTAPRPIGNGWCNNWATELDVCIDTANAYYCSGKCCCEEQLGFRCNEGTGQCTFGFTGPPTSPSPISPGPGPTPSSGPPLTVTPFPPPSRSTFAPSVTAPGSRGSTPGSSSTPVNEETWFIVLMIAMALLLCCCAIAAFLYGKRKGREEGTASIAATPRSRRPSVDFEKELRSIPAPTPEPRHAPPVYAHPERRDDFMLDAESDDIPDGTMPQGPHQPSFFDVPKERPVVGGVGRGRGTLIPPPPASPVVLESPEDDELFPPTHTDYQRQSTFRSLPRNYPSESPPRPR